MWNLTLVDIGKNQHGQACPIPGENLKTVYAVVEYYNRLQLLKVALVGSFETILDVRKI